MGILTRAAVPRRSVAEAVHARVADGEHLWLAVRGAESLVLARDSGPDIEVVTTLETHGDDVLLTAVVPVAEALADDGGADVELWLAHGPRRRPVLAGWAPRPASPTLEAPTTVDGRWQLSVHDTDGRVVVRRTPVEHAVVVLAVTAAEDGVALRLDGGTQVTIGDAVATVPVIDGVVLIDGSCDLPVGVNQPITCDGRPVTRRRNVLDRPNYATAFPALPAPDVELRWLRDGRLALYCSEALQ